MLISENNPKSHEWAMAIGTIMQNFGMLELLTIEIMAHFRRPPNRRKITRMHLQDRIKWICDNCESSLTAEAISALRSAKLLCEVRNAIAHGALLLAKGHPSDEIPTPVGILNLRPKDEQLEAELISLEEIRGRIRELAKHLKDVHAECIRIGCLGNAVTPTKTN
jgi:hypothetical protein